MDTQMEDHFDQKRSPQRNRPKQLQTHNVPTDDVKPTTAQIKEEICYLLISRGIFTDEQKECCKRIRRTGKLLYIDQHILNESKTRWKKTYMSWIDYKNTYDMASQRRILHCLKMYKITD